MITRLIIFLIRMKLGLKKGECFRFDNQRSRDDMYYFSNICIWKIEHDKYGMATTRRSSVSLNWLLNSQCKIEKVKP